MKESFLHYVWHMQYFNKHELRTTLGEKIEIFKQGNLNTDAGPDFSNARIRIGSMDWIGNVEIHTRSSAWLEHHHETDPAYENVILHVVWENDKEILRSDHTHIPTLQLKGRIDESLIRTYRQLTSSAFSIPCQKSLGKMDRITVLSMIEKALVTRLQRKSESVFTLLNQNGNDWEQTTYQTLAVNFGFRINAQPFLRLTQSVPLKIILRHSDKATDIEAILFGQAGFLDARRGDEYFQKLRGEYAALGKKYDLIKDKMSKADWRFLRMRPANFPTLRIAQFGALCQQRPGLFSSLLHACDKKTLTDIFAVEPTLYWRDHYQFSKKTSHGHHEPGDATIQNIIINTVIPIWVAYGKLHDDPDYLERSLHLLQTLPPEENRITKAWKDAGLVSQHAFDSQGLIELYNNFCSLHNCLSCNIGAALIRPSP